MLSEEQRRPWTFVWSRATDECKIFIRSHPCSLPPFLPLFLFSLSSHPWSHLERGNPGAAVEEGEAHHLAVKRVELRGEKGEGGRAG